MRVPFGRGAAREGDQVRFLLAVQLALLARPRSVIDGGLKSFLTSGDLAALTNSTSLIPKPLVSFTLRCALTPCLAGTPH